MKNVFLLLCILSVICLTACGKNVNDAQETSTDKTIKEDTNSVENESEDEKVIQTENMDNKILVAYFSRTGNTKVFANYVAEYYSADLYEIVAKVPYTEDDINYNDLDSRTSREQNDSSVRPEIEEKVQEMSQYETIILAYPIWWGQAPRIIDTFLESYDFSGKTIIPFCTSATSDIGTSDENLHSLVSESVNWIKGKRVAAGSDKEELTSWLNEVYPAMSEESMESEMKLYMNDLEIPVIWEDNETIDEIKSEVQKGDISVSMSMYSDNEQVGSLGKSYTTEDKQMTTGNGDIVLYGGNQIVVFYGNHFWSYTKLGKMDLPEDEVTALLGNGKITLRISL